MNVRPSGSPCTSQAGTLINGYPASAALAGSPLVSVPAGEVLGLPVGLTFMGRAWSEPRLIAFAYAFEQAVQPRRPPRYLTTVAG